MAAAVGLAGCGEHQASGSAASVAQTPTPSPTPAYTPQAIDTSTPPVMPVSSATPASTSATLSTYSAPAATAATSAGSTTSAANPPTYVAPTAGGSKTASTQTTNPAQPTQPPSSARQQRSTATIASTTTSAPSLNVAAAGSALFTGAYYAPGAYSTPSHGGVRLSTVPGGSLHGKVIVIDPGHNGHYSSSIDGKQVYAGFGIYKACNTSGTASPGGYAEHSFTWDVGRRLASILRSQGATVWLTRPSDSGYGPCIDQRAAVGNAAHANFVMSIHADGSSASNRGFHVIYGTHMMGGSAVLAASKNDAIAVRNAFQSIMPRSTYIGGGTALSPRGDLGGINLSRVPEAMIECGNMANSADEAKLSSAAWRASAASRLATAIAGIVG